jgi:putative heme transporter
MAASIAPWPVLLACLRASGLTQAQVSWQASLTAFAMVRLLTVLPVTPGGLGIVELGAAGAQFLVTDRPPVLPRETDRAVLSGFSPSRAAHS